MMATIEQLGIQSTAHRSVLVKANAGAAKTTTLALRIGELLARGHPPQNILALTYTDSARRALRDAMVKVGIQSDMLARVGVTTYNRFAVHCLDDDTQVISEPEQTNGHIWKALEQLREQSSEHDIKRFWSPVDGDNDFSEMFLRFAAKAKGMLVREAAFWEERNITWDFAEEIGMDFTLLRLLGKYEKLRFPQGDDFPPRFRFGHDATYDLARIIGDPNYPMSDRRSLIGKWPLSVKALLVDEMHDLNAAMFTITKRIVESFPDAYFCGVGDSDQVIHASAGADRKYMDKALFEDTTGRQVKVMNLTASFRFGKGLATHVGFFSTKPYASGAKHETQVIHTTYEDDIDCATQVVSAAKAWKSEKRPLSELAVLLRQPHQSILIENALLEAGMPYSTTGFETYLHRPEVLLVRALLAIGLNRFDTITSVQTRKRIVEALVSFCQVELDYGQDDDKYLTPVQRLEIAINEVTLHPDTIRIFLEGPIFRGSSAAVRRRLSKSLKIVQEVREASMFPMMLNALEMAVWANDRWVEKQRRVDAIAHLQGLKIAASGYSDVVAFFDHLNQMEIKHEKHEEEYQRAAKLSRLHLADVATVKGLEFEHVILPFLAQGEFPASNCESPTDERNMMYVAMTRARSVLSVITSATQPSEFVGQLGI
ncbi:Putative ATP-dependent DNA helicase YjcD [Curvibacter sp. AEP1-3]|uniref:3'-5' exonuclease n=1 Tax=Curvibacter sp. AEP1-3 TaxID=1844971 RepID=UPI000B56EDD1|nr:ATP-dependent helicase [Curvibacter sp. AEP1-3]ARV18560.1 Putative ATP-dependent DNA helicase YjcD [Curvibacter sp. AEP1-3]